MKEFAFLCWCAIGLVVLCWMVFLLSGCAVTVPSSLMEIDYDRRCLERVYAEKCSAKH